MKPQKTYFANLNIPDNKRIKIDMDYKEKYEEAYKLYHSEKTTKDQKYVLERLFPELEESEDEVIRKHLIKHFGKKSKEDWNGVPVKRILAWLEKQGEQILANSAKTCKDEQNTVVVIPKFRVGDVIRPKGSTAEYIIESISGECYHGKGWGLHISCDDDYELVEQKSAWSEDDDENFKWFEKFFRAESVLSDGRDIPQERYLWFKSLKDRYAWKPSDEQMKALKHAFNNCSIAFADMKILATLYEQLKALHRYEQDT